MAGNSIIKSHLVNFIIYILFYFAGIALAGNYFNKVETHELYSATIEKKLELPYKVAPVKSDPVVAQKYTPQKQIVNERVIHESTEISTVYTDSNIEQSNAESKDEIDLQLLAEMLNDSKKEVQQLQNLADFIPAMPIEVDLSGQCLMCLI